MSKIIKGVLAKATILVVDDKRSIRDTLQEILESMDYKVEVAEDGYTAIQMVKKTHFDVVLADVIMPGIDGLQTLDEIKKIDSKTNVIMMSVYTREGFIEKADSKRAFARIEKPFDCAELLELINRAIEH